MARINLILLFVLLFGVTAGSKVVVEDFEIRGSSNGGSIFSSVENRGRILTEQNIYVHATVNGSPISLQLKPSKQVPIADDVIVEFRDSAFYQEAFKSKTFVDENLNTVLTVTSDGYVTGRISVNGKIKTIESSFGDGTHVVALEDYEIPEEESKMNNNLRNLGRLSLRGKMNNNLRNLGSVRKFTKCRLDEPKVLNIGIIIGSSLAKHAFSNNVNRARAWLENVIVETNIVFQPLNIAFRVKEIKFWDKSNNLDNDECKWKIYQHYYVLSRNIDSAPDQEIGFWHVLDDCQYPGDSFSGMASVNTVCDNRAVALSRVGTRSYAWITFAHESGHVLGFNHHSNNGLMDVRDKEIDGQVQLNEDSISDDECIRIKNKIQCAAFESPTCGNGVLEAGEECECKNGKTCKCCENCRLKANAVCSETEQCCTDECQHATANVDCTTGDGLAGYCGAFGRCTKSFCDVAVENFEGMCGHYENNDCKIKCKPKGESRCDDLTRYTPNDIMNVKDGSLCRQGQNIGICEKGECSATVSNPPSCFECPARSEATKGCPQSINDCRCNEGYQMDAGTCVSECFNCPENSSKDRTCPRNFDDCSCKQGYLADTKNEICTSCFMCSSIDAINKKNKNCPKSYKDCECAAGMKMKDQKCTPCDEFDCRGIGGFRKDGKSCIKSYKECECSQGQKMKDKKCTSCDTFDCRGIGGFRKDGKSCIKSYKECECSQGQKMKDKKCTSCDTFDCNDIGGYRKDGKPCVKSHRDCQCPSGKKMKDKVCQDK